MNIESLTRIDLNLLVILQVLLEEQSVTRAAHRLNVSQSALSKSLTRLRNSLNDPLFSRTAYGLKPTAHALQIKQQLPNLLQNIYQLTQAPSFEAETSTRRFSISMLESAYAALLPSYIGSVLQQAPNIRVDTLSWSKNSIQELQQGNIDFGITALDLSDKETLILDKLADDIEHSPLLIDRQVCLVNDKHAVLSEVEKNAWNMESYLAHNHLQVRCEGKEWWKLDYFLASQNKHRNIICTLPDFYGAVSVCAHSELIFTVPSSFVSHAQKLYPLKEVPLPFSFSRMAYVLLWHQRNNEEPGHKWLRDMICSSINKNN